MHLFLASLVELCDSNDVVDLSFGDLSALNAERLAGMLRFAFPNVTHILDLQNKVDLRGQDSQELAGAVLRHYPRVCEP